VGANRFRIPDIAISETDHGSEVPTSPPLAVVEILSPDDRIGYIVPKLEEYRQWGVRHIWIADPDSRKFFTYGDAGLHETTSLTLPEHGVTLSLADIFGEAGR
jgi:Uma2 family endonuclease